MKWLSVLHGIGLIGSLLAPVQAIQLDLGSKASIKSAAKTVAAGMTKYYTGYRPGDVPGNLPDPYYWWEAGAMFGALIEYWHYTGDKTYNDITVQAMMHQIGPNKNYMPPNQSQSLGNDDQCFWGMSAMAAAEYNFQDPGEGNPSWVALAQAVYNSQVPRWHDTSCGGGLKWQIYQFNNGYTYKNTISNGCLFNLAARLAKYTGNSTYSEWAVKVWDWTHASGFITDDYHFYDGADDKTNCSTINKLQWTYNAGIYLYGSAMMWNMTGADLWKTRVEGIISGLSVFGYNGSNVLFEVACERNGKCNVDQKSFKAYLARWMAATIKVAPWTEPLLIKWIQTSATAAAQSCTGGADGQQCGMRWYTPFDGFSGVGEQMSALEIIQANLYTDVAGPLSIATGGNSKSDPGAGGDEPIESVYYRTLSAGDRAGAGILTALILGVILTGAWWMVS